MSYFWLIILLAILTIILLVSKKLTIFVVSWFIARLLKCSSVKYGHVGLFSVADIKLHFEFLKIEIDKIYLSSCFINQDYTKPIVLCINDVRLEISKPISTVVNVSNSNGFTSTIDEDILKKRFRRYSAILQYVCAIVDNLNVVYLLSVALPDYLVHLAIEGIHLDTFRDRKSIQCEIAWKFLTCKALPRCSLPGGSSLDMPQGASLAVHVDPSLYTLKLFAFKCSNPVFNISDVFLQVLSFKREISSDTAVIERNPDFANLMPLKVDLEFRNVNFGLVHITSSGKTRQLTSIIKSILFSSNRIEYYSEFSQNKGTFELDLVDLQCSDSDNLSFSVAACRALYRKSFNDESSLECYIVTLTGNLKIEALKLWAKVLQEHIRRPSENRNPSSVNKNLTFVSVELSSTDCTFVLPDEKMLVLSLELLDLTRNNSNSSEIGIEALCMSYNKPHKSSIEFEHGAKLHKWGKIIDLGQYILTLESDSGKRKIWSQVEHFYVEWNLELVKSLHSALCDTEIFNIKATRENTTKLNLDFRISIYDFLFVLPVKDTICIVLSAVEFKSSFINEVFVLNFKDLECYKKKFSHKKMLALQIDSSCSDTSAIPNFNLVYKTSLEHLIVSCSSNISLSWSPLLHMAIVDSMKELSTFLSGLNIFVKRAENVSGSTSTKQFKISAADDLTLNFNLEHCSVKWTLRNTKFYRTDTKKAFKFDQCTVRFDSHQIFTFDTFCMKRLESHSKMDELRLSCEELETEHNYFWLTQLTTFSAVFPYNYDFAEALEELINVIKWLKEIHALRKPSFYPGQPLPADMMICISSFEATKITARLEMCDDLFEVKLRDNYELLMDEYFEGERRKQILDQKIEDLRKGQPMHESYKVNELYDSLRETNSAIYVERSKKMYISNPRRSSLFSWTLEEFELKCLADQSYHGDENFIKNVQLMNPESASPWPQNASFNTAWCRYIGFDFKEWLMQMRDYPQPYWLMTNGHFFGRLAGAEIEGNDRSKRTVTVHVGYPFSSFSLHRNMQFLKFYYDLGANITTDKMTYGPCWEPCLALINLCFEKILRPSVDPSPPLPFWDKIRLLWHGRLSMMIDKYVAAMLASSDPYDTTEQMEFAWSNFEFDWTNGVILVISDLDAYVRTASKYDDHCLLHLPSMKLNIRMKWICNAENPNDHHSVSPCAPDKLPDYSVHKEHDSYRAFRSQHLNLSLSLDIKNLDDELISEDQRPSVSFYANTFRWLDGLKNTISAVNRPIKRGPMFQTPRQKKAQLSRHYRDIILSVSLPKFFISYWTSSTNDKGFRLFGRKIALKSVHRLSLSLAKPLKCSVNNGALGGGSGNANHNRQVDNRSSSSIDILSRRLQTTFRTITMVAELTEAEIYLYKKLMETGDMPKSFFMSIDRLSYSRDDLVSTSLLRLTPDSNPRHKVVASDLKAAWTNSNRDVVLSILDGLQKATVLRRNLSTDALKSIPVADDLGEKTKPRKCYPGQNQNSTSNLDQTGAATCSPPPVGQFEGDYAADMLQQLINEAATKFMAYSEETSEIPSQQLHGIVLSQMDDVLFTKWQIEVMNSQVMLKGCETSGYVLCTAAKAQITQRLHSPVWRENQLLAKTTWVAMLNGMQYYATVINDNRAAPATPNKPTLDDVKWLSKELIQEKTCSNQNLDVVDSLLTQGQAAGGVVGENSPNNNQDQLQRIISKCDCQLYFCQFADNADLDELGDDVRPLEVDDESQFWKRKEFVDCFTLKHNMLNVSTNHLQYATILDIVNNLILYVDPKNKESAEKLIRYRFQLQLQSVDDLRPNITMLQNEVREILSNQRFLERQTYLLNKKLGVGVGEAENAESAQLHEIKDEIKEEMERCKIDLLTKSDDLALMISCFREKQVQRYRQAQLKVNEDQQQAQIARRFEVCFEDALWRLTGDDGQIGLSDLRIRNFLYTKISRINDSGEHSLELGFLKITTLLPNSPYKDVLQPQQRNKTLPNDRMPAVRIICRELAPVGGISVKEHFEINVVPMVVQMSYAFFRTMMNYFFPDRNIDTEDQQNLDTVDDQQSTSEEKSSVKKPKFVGNKNTKNKKRSKIDSKDAISDDIDKMKKRAETNNMFLYIKIPEVPFIVSYKGEKEKNIEDVDNFQLEIPLIEYHDRNWTWLDLALAIKQRCKRVLLQQFMKQKLLKSRIGAAFSNSEQKLDLMNLPEEEKARMLLGTKLMGTPEKSKSRLAHFLPK